MEPLLTEILRPNAKGELTLEICGESRVLKLSMEMLNEIETTLNMGILVLGQRAASGDFRLKDMAVVFHYGIKGNDPKTKVTWEQIAQWIMDEGLLNIARTYAAFLLPVLTAGPNKKGEAKPQTATATA